MKICALTDVVPSNLWDASEAYLHALLSAFAASGHQVTTLSENVALCARETHDGVSYLPVTVGSAFPTLAAMDADVLVSHAEPGRHGHRYAEYLRMTHVTIIPDVSSESANMIKNGADLVLFADSEVAAAFDEDVESEYMILADVDDCDVITKVLKMAQKSVEV